ncbi:hypothetical protein VXQ18_14625 [Brucella abortus]|nr:hypothetical protein [Brucella abortus]
MAQACGQNDREDGIVRTAVRWLLRGFSRSYCYSEDEIQPSGTFPIGLSNRKETGTQGNLQGKIEIGK